MLTASTPPSSLCHGSYFHSSSGLTVNYVRAACLIFSTYAVILGSFFFLFSLLSASSPQLSAEDRVHAVVRGDFLSVRDAQTESQAGGGGLPV